MKYTYKFTPEDTIKHNYYTDCMQFYERANYVLFIHVSTPVDKWQGSVFSCKLELNILTLENYHKNAESKL